MRVAFFPACDAGWDDDYNDYSLDEICVAVSLTKNSALCLLPGADGVSEAE